MVQSISFAPSKGLDYVKTSLWMSADFPPKDRLRRELPLAQSHRPFRLKLTGKSIFWKNSRIWFLKT